MKNKKSDFLAGLVFGLVLAVGLMATINMTLAAWSEPTQPPPGGNVDPFSKTLTNVLADGSDAGSFAGNVNIGSALNTANLYILGGEIKGKWIHSTASGDNNIAGNLNVGGKLRLGTVTGCVISGACVAGDAGALCYNSTDKQFLGCNGTVWNSLGGGTYN